MAKPVWARPMNRLLAAALTSAALCLSACSSALSLSSGSPSDPSAQNPSIPSSSKPVSPVTNPKTDPETKVVEPFCTWNQETVIPFVYYVNKEARMALWDLEKGTVSFHDKSLFSVDGVSRSFAWDGGDRFVFGNAGVKRLDERIRVECVDVRSDLTWQSPGYVIAAPSGNGSLFLVYRDTENRLMLEIKDHPLAGKLVMDPPELAAGTRIDLPVGIEVTNDEIAVYFTTSRYQENRDPKEPDHVFGLLQVRYYPAATMRPFQWRVINPDIPVAFAGSGPWFWQSPNEIVITSRVRNPQVVNLTTGVVGEVSEFTEGLRQASSGGAVVEFPAQCFGYRDLRILEATCVGRDGDTAADHVLAFRGAEVIGRIEFASGNFNVYKGGLRVSGGACPAGLRGPLYFPQSVEQIRPNPVGADHFMAKEQAYDTMWRKARFADLFNEPSRTDGAVTDQISIILMARFVADPSGFVKALSLASAKDTDLVGDLLAYNADYKDLNAYRAKMEALKKEFPSGKELVVLDRLLDRLTQFEIRMGRRKGS